MSDELDNKDSETEVNEAKMAKLLAEVQSRLAAAGELRNNHLKLEKTGVRNILEQAVAVVDTFPMTDRLQSEFGSQLDALASGLGLFQESDSQPFQDEILFKVGRISQIREEVMLQLQHWLKGISSKEDLMNWSLSNGQYENEDITDTLGRVKNFESALRQILGLYEHYDSEVTRIVGYIQQDVGFFIEEYSRLAQIAAETVGDAPDSAQTQQDYLDGSKLARLFQVQFDSWVRAHRQQIESDYRQLNNLYHAINRESKLVYQIYQYDQQQALT